MKNIKVILFFLVPALITSCSTASTYSDVKTSVHRIELDGFTSFLSNGSQNSNQVVKINPFSIQEDKHDESEYKEDKDKLKITDVTLNNLSIMSDKGVSSILPDFNGKDILLTIKGVFKTESSTIKKTQFQYEQGLFNQSIVGNKPETRVLLDESIIFEILSISKSEITVKINSKWIPDLYLKGLHKLRVISGEKSASVFVKVGDPSPVNTLSPKILSVEVLKTKDDDSDNKSDKNNKKPNNILIKGSNFMMYYRFSYSTIDGVFCYGHQTNILNDGSFESIIHIPDPKKFDPNKKHILMYTTPFGSVLKEFQ